MNSKIANKSLVFYDDTILGKDMRMIATNDGYVDIFVNISINPAFLAQMLIFGDSVRIKEPKSLILAMKNLIKKITFFLIRKQ